MKPVIRAAVLLVSVTCALGTAVPVCGAAPAEQASYVSLRHPQPVGEAAKREVVEVFWYGCQHSQLLEGPLEEWAARRPADVVLRRLPAVWPGDSDQTAQRAHARLYFTLEQLGEVDRLQRAVFHAVRDEGLDLTTEAAAADWAVAQQVDRERFTAAYESDRVRQEVAQAPDDLARYEVTELPSAVVQGRYLTSPTRAGGVDAVPRVLDQLLEQVRSERAASAAPTT
ncbi:thiol:disulfide interchange protein DsbA/DsbL [Kitasatospora sp. NBC_01287]|uniref:thiol:disulfide interchange protein DsbA/DsbL n=1 Tax=Kitasatospora sp. NBC_01287 TaxID=2903573 RepID=UPI00225B8D19|nr:thiol:disulfide interchange protein DsbA/DsbL [Kitasatospora sp. NBC_01287]MCX4750707.1 thiol:disulfide interchange protein DsbA/DsbL [Kitasatospora sp. NBC_01287]